MCFHLAKTCRNEPNDYSVILSLAANFFVQKTAYLIPAYNMVRLLRIFKRNIAELRHAKTCFSNMR